jgi:hypothetical protein
LAIIQAIARNKQTTIVSEKKTERAEAHELVGLSTVVPESFEGGLSSSEGLLFDGSTEVFSTPGNAIVVQLACWTADGLGGWLVLGKTLCPLGKSLGVF